MTIYKPTWLYVKQHNVTGLKYFGKTTVNDPTKYPGSGIFWRKHLAKHGNNTSTQWSKLFENKDELVEYALLFSKENNIVDSNEWANLKEENGLDGMPPGITAFNKGLKQAHKPHKQRSDKGKPRECFLKSGSPLRGRIRPRLMCPHCGKNIDEANYHRYHGDKCKLK